MLKRVSFMVLCMASIFCIMGSANAQEQRPSGNLAYASISGGYGLPVAFATTVSYVFHRRHELSFGYSYFERRAKEIPEDYESAGLYGRTHYPQESFRGVTLSYGRVLFPKRAADRLRFVLRSGLLIGQ